MTAGVEFTPEQRAEMQRRIDKAFGQGRREGEAAVRERLAELEAQCAEAVEARDDALRHLESAQGVDADAAQRVLAEDFERRLAAAASRIEALEGGIAAQAIALAARELDALVPQVMPHHPALAGRVRVTDRGEPYVVDETGAAATRVVVRDGHPETVPVRVPDLVKQVLEREPELRRGTTTHGAGTAGSAGGAGHAPPRSIQQLIERGLAHYVDR